MMRMASTMPVIWMGDSYEKVVNWMALLLGEKSGVKRLTSILLFIFYTACVEGLYKVLVFDW